MWPLLQITTTLRTRYMENCKLALTDVAQLSIGEAHSILLEAILCFLGLSTLLTEEYG